MEGTASTWLVRYVLDALGRDGVDSRALAHRIGLLGEGLNRQAAAARLGYADTRALRRALNRWKAASPAP